MKSLLPSLLSPSNKIGKPLSTVFYFARGQMCVVIPPLSSLPGESLLKPCIPSLLDHFSLDLLYTCGPDTSLLLPPPRNPCFPAPTSPPCFPPPPLMCWSTSFSSFLRKGPWAILFLFSRPSISKAVFMAPSQLTDYLNPEL